VFILEKYLAHLTEKFEVYDKGKWHSDEGGNYRHIELMLYWLKKKQCLTKEGLEEFDGKISSDTAIHSNMLKPKCQKAMEKCYGKWVKTLDYKRKPDIKTFEKCARGL